LAIDEADIGAVVGSGNVHAKHKIGGRIVNAEHSIVDLIGDLALIGKPLLGHVIAERAGHAMHTALVARIMSDPSLYEMLSFDQLATRVAHALVS